MARQEVTGIAGSSRNSLKQALKEHYFDKWRDAINNEQNLNALVNGKNKGSLEGNQSKIYHSDSDVASAGQARLEMDDLPTPQGSTHLQGNLHARDIYLRVRITGQAKRSTKGSSYVKAWKKELSSARRRHSQQLNRMLYTGPRQILSTVSAESSATLTLFARDTRTGAADDFWKFGYLFLRKGDAIVGIDASAGSPVPYGAVATGAVRYITDIDRPNNQITISDSPGGSDAAFATLLGANASGALLVPYLSRPTAAVTPGTDSDSQFSGINGLFNTIGTASVDAYIYDLARATYDSLSGTVSANAGTTRVLSDQLLDLQMDTQMEHPNNGGQDTETLLMSRHNRRVYVAATEADRRYRPVQTKRGYGRLQYMTGDRPSEILTDRECPPGLIFCLAKSTMGRYEQAPLDYVDEGDQFRFVSDKDANEVNMVESCNFGCENIAANGWLDDLSFNTDGTVTV